MNIHQRDLKLPDGDSNAPAPRRWSSNELLRMDEAGLFGEGEHVELIDGEIIKMSPKGNRHELVRSELSTFWGDRRGTKYKIAQEPPLHLGKYDEPEPDIIIYGSAERVYEVTGQSVLLAVEVSNSSLSYDLKIKAPMYAAHGVRDYWVVDVRAMRVTVHRDPGADGYADVRTYEPSELLTPLLAPELALKLADLDFGPLPDDSAG